MRDVSVYGPIAVVDCDCGEEVIIEISLNSEKIYAYRGICRCGMFIEYDGNSLVMAQGAPDAKYYKIPEECVEFSKEKFGNHYQEKTKKEL